VLVWGRARGLLHAGSKADSGAVICGLDLSGAQLRIAGEPAPEHEPQKDARPETVSIDSDGRWQIVPWQAT
jgi:septum site-determining protein MinC